ncbi:MAG: hypothetical protein U1A78_41020 [Polyangia bacterium]
MALRQESNVLAAEHIRAVLEGRPVSPAEGAAIHLSLPGERPSAELDPRGSPLLQAIEREIIPRLLFTYRAEARSPAPCADSRPPPSRDELAEFAALAAKSELAEVLGYVERLGRQGLSLEALLLHLIGPTARALGEQWQDDRLSFTEVTAGLGMLQQVVHTLSPSFAPKLPNRGLVVLMAAPGEQHTLGLLLVGEFLRRAGWGVHTCPVLSEGELLEIVSSQRLALLGITVSNDHLLKPLAALLTKVRRVSVDPELLIMLGGALDLSEFAASNRVQLCTSDPREVVLYLEQHATLRGYRN